MRDSGSENNKRSLLAARKNESGRRKELNVKMANCIKIEGSGSSKQNWRQYKNEQTSSQCSRDDFFLCRMTSSEQRPDTARCLKWSAAKSAQCKQTPRMTQVSYTER